MSQASVATDTGISQDSVATPVRYLLITNLLLSLPMTEFRKSVNLTKLWTTV